MSDSQPIPIFNRVALEVDALLEREPHKLQELMSLHCLSALEVRAALIYERLKAINAVVAPEEPVWQPLPEPAPTSNARRSKPTRLPKRTRLD